MSGASSISSAAYFDSGQRARAPAVLDPDVASDSQPMLLADPAEHRQASLSFRIIGRERHKHANATNALALLRAHCNRPNRSRPPRSMMNSRPFHSITHQHAAELMGYGKTERFWQS